MNDGVLAVNFAALHTAGDDIERALNKLQSDLQELEASARPLMSTWDGDAKAAYEARQAQWRAAANDLSAILRDIRGAVTSSADDYMSTEKRAASLFQ